MMSAWQAGSITRRKKTEEIQCSCVQETLWSPKYKTTSRASALWSNGSLVMPLPLCFLPFFTGFFHKVPNFYKRGRSYVRLQRYTNSSTKCTTESRFVNLIHFSDHLVIHSRCTCHSFYVFNKHRHRKFVSFSLHLCENHPHQLFLFAHVQSITLLCWFDHHGNLFEGVGSSIERHHGSGFNSV